MGGVLIKVGQVLSSRVDVLPLEITEELAGLQDAVPPEPFEAIRRLAEAELGAPLHERFLSFEEVPLASASLGQVHRARIAGELQAVVVKIQRPQIESLLAVDLAALRTVGGWLQRYPPVRRRADVPALLNEFARILYEEVDYLAEGRNAEAFAANFQGQAEVHIPRIVWTHTTRRVLTLEEISGIKINDYEAITAAGIERSEVARRLLQVYFKQILEDGFFHADPHPGNLFVSPQSEGWQLTFVDFGMTAQVPTALRPAFREVLIAMATRDAGRLIKAFQLMGMLLPNADLKLIERAADKVLEMNWGRTIPEMMAMSDQKMELVTGEFRELLYDLPFQVPQNLIFLGRAVGILAGLCTGLDPQFNFWEELTPYAQKLMSEKDRSPAGMVWDELKLLSSALIALPVRAETLLGRLERGEVEVRLPQLVGPVERLEAATRRLTRALVFAALLISGTGAYLYHAEPLAEVLLGGAAVALVSLFFRKL
jgi:predicted unusual protein kinase regulating ubiquinone biosynthesis (AarF/ABC1/UbiB family)